MSARCFRHILLLSLACLTFACADTADSELIIDTCVDQDGRPLPAGVTVSVNGVSEIWQGAPIRFPVKVKGPVQLINVKAGASPGYTYNSKSQFAVRPNVPTTVKLHFFKSYTVRVNAVDEENDVLSGAEVYANGARIGRTDERGRFTWTIEAPNTDAGIARPGTRFDIRLERNGEQAVAAPVILAAQQFSYAAEARLGEERSTPYFGFAANTLAPTQATDTPNPNARRPASSEAETPSSSTPSSSSSTTFTEAQPRPLDLEPSTDPETLPTDLAPPPSEVPVDAPPAAGTPSLLQQGDQAFATGQYEAAKRIYSSIPTSDETFKRARQRLGEIHLETNNYEGAIAAFEDIIREDPSEYAAYNNLAAVYLATESYNNALDNLDKVLARKHLIPRSKRKAAELDVRYTRASIHYVQFQNERDPITKKEQGLLTMSVVQTFIDMTSANDPVFVDKRREMQSKLDDIRLWIRNN